MFKKIIIGLGLLFVLVVGTLIAIPYFYTVDNLRPQIQAELNKSFRGKVELGAFSLSAFPVLKFKIAGVKVMAPLPFEKEPLAEIESLGFEMSLLSLLSAPRVTAAVEKPMIRFVTQEKTNNVTSFLPEAPTTGSASESAAAKNAPTAPPTALGPILNKLPGFVRSRVYAARMSVQINGGQVQVKNQSSAASAKDVIALKELDFKLSNIGIQVPMALNFSTDVEVRMAAASVLGALATNGSITLTPEGEKHVISVAILNDLSGLDIKSGALFHKAKGTPFNLDLEGAVTQGKEISAAFPKIEFQFAQLRALSNLKAMGLENTDNAKISFESGVKNFDIAGFGTLIPMIRDFSLGGMVNANILVEGRALDPNFKINVNFSKMTGSTPQLKKPVSDLTGKLIISGTAKNPRVEVNPVSLKLGNSDFEAELVSVGALPVTLSMKVKANKIDVDEMLGLEALKVGVEPTAKGAPGAGSSGKAAALNTAPLDETLSAMAPTIELQAANPMLGQLTASIDFEAKAIRMLGADFLNAKSNLQFKGKKLSLSKTSVSAYGGNLVASMGVNLNEPKEVGYEMEAQMKGVKMEQAIATHAPQWKGMLSGAMDGSFQAAGRGFKKDQLSSTLSGGMKGNIVQGKVTLPVAKIVAELLTKIPKVGGKSFELPASNEKYNGEFKSAVVEMLLKGRTMNFSNLDIVYDTKKLGIGDLEFKGTRGTVNFDRQVDIEGVAFMSPEVVRIAELKGPSGRIEVPMRVKGDMSDPKPDIGYTLGILGPRVAKNAIQGKGGELVKGAVAKEAVKILEKNSNKIPAPAKKQIDALKDNLKKKFKF